MKITVTQEILDMNPDLVDLGIVIGQEIETDDYAVSLTHEDPSPSVSDPGGNDHLGDPIEVPKKPPPIPSVPPQE